MKSILQLGCILILSLALSSCRTIQGGGWIESASGVGKATFGIDITCKDSVYYGEFTYHDHGVKVEMPDGKMRKLAIHAWIEHGEFPVPMAGWEADAFLNLPQECTSWDFKYLAIADKSNKLGTGTIVFCDADLTEDISDGDSLSINLIDPNGTTIYSNEGELGGGNLTIYDE